ncbi:hypothetical protein CCACVL1_00068, partial [Corchorus capsularis]
MELSMSVAGNQGPLVAEPKKIKDAHKGGKVSSEKAGSKQSMAVDAKPLKISKRKAQDAKSFTTQDKAKGKSTLKERQEKKYPFPDSDVASMLDELLKSKVIELPKMKRPEESDKASGRFRDKTPRQPSSLIPKPAQVAGGGKIASQAIYFV